MISEYLTLILRGIKHRKLRTSLTVLGIVIGIGAVVALMLVSTGLENSIKDQFAKIGTNRLFLSMKSASAAQIQSGLTEDDVKAIEGLPYFKYITTYLIKSWQIEYAKQTKTMSITANSLDNIAEIWADMDMGVAEGRVFQRGDKYSVIIGQKIANNLFNNKKVRVNSNILIHGQQFKVIGVFKEFGNPQDDSNVFIPIEAAREILGGNNKEVSMVDLLLKPGVDVNEAADAVRRAIRDRRNIRPGNEDFQVSTPDQLLAQMNGVLGVIQIVLLCIAIISLVVGSIGIMNSMYTSVLERTRDIGVMRAVGANYYNILTLFLIEAFIIGIFGGVLGALLGAGIAKMFEIIAHTSGYNIFNVQIIYSYIIFSILFSGFIGVIAGYLPAKRAASLKPAEALRA